MKKKKVKNSGLVYSTEHGKMCPGCGKPTNLCGCGKKSTPPNDGIVRIMKSTQGRKGKGVMLITGVPLNNLELKKLGKELKAKFGVGGSIKNGIIELQGDFRDKLVENLSQRGWKVKISGG